MDRIEYHSLPKEHRLRIYRAVCILMEWIEEEKKKNAVEAQATEVHTAARTPAVELPDAARSSDGEETLETVAGFPSR